MKTNLFITGGSGFIGKHFIDRFHFDYHIKAIARDSSVIYKNKCKVFYYDRDINKLNDFFIKENIDNGGGYYT